LEDALDAAESRLLEGMVIPSLKGERERWPRDLVETKVDCYLIEDGWSTRDIFVLHHDGEEPSNSNRYRYIGDRVYRAKISGEPRLIWGWKRERNADEERRLLELVEQPNLPRERKP